LITGATGTLGRAFARLCTERDLNFRLLTRAELDIADARSIERAVDRYEPWAIINTAGYVRVDEAENDVERCFRENTHGPATLAAVCARYGIGLVTFSTDLVFDGERDAPYVENDETQPINVYGRSKAEAEKRVLDRHPESLVVRTSSFFGPWDEHNFITLALRALKSGQPFVASGDLTVSPTYVPDLVNQCLDLLIDREQGIVHLTNGDAVTWADLAQRAAERADVDTASLRICRNHRSRLIAPRPRFSAMRSRRTFSMPTLDDALNRYMQQAAS
ncbi:MAG TPA: SDR family oxidoreductase, partial [Lysobacter sp.]